MGKGEVAGVGRGYEGKGREVKGNVHYSSPLSMRIDLEKNFRSMYVVSGPKIVDDKYVPIDWK